MSEAAKVICAIGHLGMSHQCGACDPKHLEHVRPPNGAER